MATPIDKIQSSLSSSLSTISTQQDQQKALIRKEAEAQREKIKAEASAAERQAQEAAEKVRAERAKELKSRAIAGRTVPLKTYQDALSAIEKERLAILAGTQASEASLTKAEAEALKLIDKEAKEVKAEITAEAEAQIKDWQEFAKKHVELDSGEWVDKKEFDGYTPEEQLKLKELGIEEFNKQMQISYEQAVKEAEVAKQDFEAKHIKLDSGEWILREIYDDLKKEDQEKLHKLGTAAFQKELSAMQAKDTAEFRATHVELDGGEWVDKDLFEQLTPSQKKELRTLGVEEFNALQETRYAKAQEELEKFEQDNINIRDDEWVAKEFYNSLNKLEQSKLKELGIDGFNDYLTAKHKDFEANHVKLNYKEEWVDKDFYNSLDKESQSRLSQIGTDAFNKEIEQKQQEFEATHRKLNYQDSDGNHEWVEEAYYNDLDSTDKDYLNKHGTDKFNELLKKREEDFKLNHTRLAFKDADGNHEWIDSDFYSSLSPNEQQSLSTLGTEEFNRRQLQEAELDLANHTLVYTDKDGNEEWLANDDTRDKNGNIISLGWNSFSASEKERIRQVGVDKFNQEQQAELVTFQKNNTFVGHDKDGKEIWLPNRDVWDYETNTAIPGWNSIPKKDQDEIKKIGYLKWQENKDKELRLTHKVIGSFTMPLTDWHNLSKEDQNYAELHGFQALTEKQKQDYQEFEQTFEPYKFKDGYDISKYIRDGIDYDTAKIKELVDRYGFNQEQINEALEFANKDFYKIGETERFLDTAKKAGIKVDNLSTRDMGYLAAWITKGQNALFTHDKQANELIKNKMVDLTRGIRITGELINSADKIATYTGKFKAADMSVEEFVANYLAVRDIPDKEAEKYYKKVAELEYINLYGQKQYDESKLVGVGEFILPALKALQPGKTKADITGADWAITAAQAGLIFISPALGAIGKAIGTTGRVASSVIKGTGKAIQAVSALTFPAITISDISAGRYKDKPVELIINIAIDTALLAAVFGKPLYNGIKSVAKATKDFAATSKAYEALGKAVKSGDVTRIQTAAINLNSTASKLKDPVRKLTISNQANWAYKNAQELATRALIMPADAFQALRATNNQITNLVKSGAAGGTIDEIARKFPDAFKKVDTAKAADNIKTTASRWLEESKTAQNYIRQKVLDPTKSMEFVNPKEVSKITKTLSSPPIDAKNIKAYTDKISKQIFKEDLTSTVGKTVQFKADVAKATELWLEVKKNLITEWAYKQVAKEIRVSKEIKNFVIQKAKEQTATLTGDAYGYVTNTRKLVTKANTQAALDNAFKLKPSPALRHLIEQNMVTVAFAYAPAKVLELITNAPTELKAKVYQSVSKQLADEIKAAIVSKNVAAASKVANKEIDSINASFNKSFTEAADMADKVMPNSQYAELISLQALQSLAESTIPTTEAVTTKQVTETAKVVDTTAQALIQPVTTTQQAIDAGIKAATKALTSTKTLTDTKIRELTKTAIEANIKTATDIKTSTKALTDTAIAIATKNITKPRVKPPEQKPRRIIRIPTDDKDKKERELTEKEAKGAVGWKQGFIYILIYPPYGNKNIVYSRSPIKGIKYHTGIKSAYKSIVALGGKLPPKIQRQLGIMDIKITTKKGAKPKLTFKRKDTRSKAQAKGLGTIKRG